MKADEPGDGKEFLDIRRLETRKLRLEIAKLEQELNKSAWPGSWEVIKTVVTWIGIGVGLATLFLSLAKADREAWASAVEDFLGDRPVQGARLVAGYGAEGVTTLVEGIQIVPDDDVARRRALAALQVLRSLEAESASESVFEDFHLELLKSQYQQGFSRAELLVEKDLHPDHELLPRERRELADLGRILKRLDSLGKIEDQSTTALVNEIEGILQQP